MRPDVDAPASTEAPREAPTTEPNLLREAIASLPPAAPAEGRGLADAAADPPPARSGRDGLFAALARATASDPVTAGANIGRVCKLLREADPPYTPAEVLALP